MFWTSLQFLVLKNERIKKKESDLKQACKLEMAELTQRNKELSDRLKAGSGRIREEPDLTDYDAKLDRLRQDLAVKSKLVSMS